MLSGAVSIYAAFIGKLIVWVGEFGKLPIWSWLLNINPNWFSVIFGGKKKKSRDSICVLLLILTSLTSAFILWVILRPRVGTRTCSTQFWCWESGLTGLLKLPMEKITSTSPSCCGKCSALATGVHYKQLHMVQL